MPIDLSVNGRLTADEGKLLKLAEHFDQFITYHEIKHPSVWRDRIPKGAFTLFDGISKVTNVFRGSLGPQTGLNDWTVIEHASTKPLEGRPGFDACDYSNAQTYSWSIESYAFRGYRTFWRSPVFCVNDLKYVDRAAEQLSMIIRAGQQVTDQVKETFNREMYVKTAVDAGKAVILADGVLNFIDDPNARFTYDPFAYPNTIQFPTEILPRISSLNWTFLDYIRTYLADQAPDAAVGTESGMPVFGLMIDLADFDKFVTSDPAVREDFRHAQPQQLITGFNMGFKVYRSITPIHDPRQMRFKITSVGPTTVTATRVAPKRAIRPGTVGFIPETNPDYLTAELAIGVMYLEKVIQILVPPTVKNLGSGMVFGPAPGFNGEWAWLNIPDIEKNPFREIGYFASRYEYYVKPLENAPAAIVFLYRRCPHALSTGCAAELQSDVAGATEEVHPVKDASSQDVDNTNYTLTLTLAKKLPGGLGDKVVCTDAAVVPQAYNAWIIDTANAPTYTFASDSAFSAYTNWTVNAKVKMA